MILSLFGEDQANRIMRIPLLNTKSVEHLARDHSFIKQVLNALGMVYLLRSDEHNWKLWVASLFLQNSLTECKSLTVAWWSLWFYRNNPYHEGVQQSVQGVVTFVKAYIGEIDALDAPSKPMTVMREDRWDTYKYVYWILIRNKEGLIMAAFTCLNNHVANSFMAEARDCERAVSFAVDLGFKNVIVEGDSLPIIKNLQSSMDDNSIVSVIVKEIKMEDAPVDVENAVAGWIYWSSDTWPWYRRYYRLLNSDALLKAVTVLFS
ncbi:hypothetical protein J1N35_007265 [Gossypium stocksii]|uniref:RNase H type-1 domain-containing protein n=1 Tax=Gossypium stocksii TaxID=47602 RepID=A0A9D3W6P8_9ROSI|nr:hypothetical protein J1N35_007265 [Gossypium stocksii]